MRIVFIALVLLTFNNVYGCVLPIIGPEYDALIEVYETEKNTFHITIPRQLNGTWVKYIGIEFEEKEPQYLRDDNGYIINSLSTKSDHEILYTHSVFEYLRIFDRKKVNLVYKAKFKEGYNQKITAVWPAEVCWIYATSKELQIK